MKTDNVALKGVFKAASAEIKENRLRVVASTCGNMDRSYTCDVIFPGAFKTAVLKGFEQNGWIDVGHGWDGLPVAYPLTAKMVGDELQSECEFHNTERGQEARTVCRERMYNGLSVSVSIGFLPDYSGDGTHWFESGKDLMQYAEDNGFDVSRFDPAIKGFKGMCRGITKVAELFEWSIVTVGANPKAKATAVKSLTAEEQFEDALEAFTLAIERETDIAALRGRVGDAQKSRLLKAVETLETLFKTDEPDPGSGKPDAPLIETLNARTLAFRTANLAALSL